MTMFNWEAAQGERVVSRYIWIYPVVMIPLTALVLGVWWLYTLAH
jgi:hypothetical protein